MLFDHNQVLGDHPIPLYVSHGPECIAIWVEHTCIAIWVEHTCYTKCMGHEKHVLHSTASGRKLLPLWLQLCWVGLQRAMQLMQNGAEFCLLQWHSMYVLSPADRIATGLSV